MAEGLQVASFSPGQIAIKRGSVWWAGERVIVVTAWPAQGGANVQIEAWAQALTEMSADPKAIVGAIPRRDTWRLASSFVSQLGVSPESVFRHL